MKVFKFKQFNVKQEHAAMKVNTDSILLSAWVDVVEKERILDIGTGTGLIALMLAQRTTNAEIHGVEIDEEACAEAKENFAATKWSDRLVAFEGSIQEYSSEEYDLIICNPPFFTGGTLSENQTRNSVRHTLKLPNNELLSSVRKLLKSDGRFAVILPFIEGLRFIEMAKSFGFCLFRKTEVYARKGKSVERLLIEFGRLKCEELATSEITIYADDSSQEYSEEYIELTRDFYLGY